MVQTPAVPVAETHAASAVVGEPQVRQRSWPLSRTQVCAAPETALQSEGVLHAHRFVVVQAI
jgi:hypothetical protein